MPPSQWFLRKATSEDPSKPVDWGWATFQGQEDVLLGSALLHLSRVTWTVMALHPRALGWEEWLIGAPNPLGAPPLFL